MKSALEFESKLTGCFQTTIPETIRRVLNIGKGDKIRYNIQENGDVIISRAKSDAADDLVLEKFLKFLANDGSKKPEKLRVVNSGLVSRIQSLTGDIEVDLNATLPKDDILPIPL